jgi:hypothetical protein
VLTVIVSDAPVSDHDCGAGIVEVYIIAGPSGQRHSNGFIGLGDGVVNGNDRDSRGIHAWVDCYRSGQGSVIGVSGGASRDGVVDDETLCAVEGRCFPIGSLRRSGDSG